MATDTSRRTAEANPFTPGYGALPHVFAGREPEFRDLQVMAERVRRGTYEQARHVTGVRGIGKTALLGELTEWAVDGGWWVVGADIAPAMQLLPVLAHRVGRLVHERAGAGERLAAGALRVLRLVSAFAGRYGGDDWHVEYRGAVVEPDRSSLTGDAGADLQALLDRACRLAAEAGTALLLVLDEVQNAGRADLGRLLYALQETQRTAVTERDARSGVRLRRSLPLGVVLAGLPSLPAAMRAASATFMSRSRAVRLGPLPDGAIYEAVPAFTEPLGVRWDADALQAIVDLAEGYPYFLHVYGYHAWLAGRSAVITAAQVERGAAAAGPMVAAFYDERLEELTDLQRAVLRAVAALPSGERTSARIARALGHERSSSIGSTLERLLDRGMLARTGRGRYDLQIPGLEHHVLG